MSSMDPDASADPHICKGYLRASQRGDLNKLQNLTRQHNITDWTLYRHDVTGDTALHVAAREGHLNVVKYLCAARFEAGFKADVANKDMKRPMHEAAQFARLSILRYLLELGAAVDPLKRADWTPLMLASTKEGNEATNCVQALLEHGADLKLKNKDGWTPLMIACRSGNLTTVQLLIDRLPNSIHDTSHNGRTLLHIAAFHGHRHIIDYLVSKDLSSLINRRDSSGSTPLLESVKKSDFGISRRLIELNADFSLADNVGQNVLHLAAMSGNVDTMKFVLENRMVDVNSESLFGLTPLTMAKRSQNSKVIDILLSFGALE